MDQQEITSLLLAIIHGVFPKKYTSDRKIGGRSGPEQKSGGGGFLSRSLWTHNIQTHIKAAYDLVIRQADCQVAL